MQPMDDAGQDYLHWLVNSCIVVPAKRLDAISAKLNVPKGARDKTAAVVKRLATLGLALRERREDGALVFERDTSTFYKHTEELGARWPQVLVELGNYFEDGSYFVSEKRMRAEPHPLGIELRYEVRGGVMHVGSTSWCWVGRDKCDIEYEESETVSCEPLMQLGAFPDIDRSAWLLSDPAWVKARQAQWPLIEPVLSQHFGKKPAFLKIVQRFFLSGEMPDWSKHVPDRQSHLDLYTFLWLHPSHDAAVLAELREQYVASPLTSATDIAQGHDHLAKLHRFSPVGTKEEIAQRQAVLPLLKAGELMFSTLHGEQALQEERRDRPGTWFGFVRWEKWRADLCDLYHFVQWLTAPRTASSPVPFLLEPSVWRWWQRDLSEETHRTRLALSLSWTQVLEPLMTLAAFDAAAGSDAVRAEAATRVRNWLDTQPHDPDLSAAWMLIKRGEFVYVKPGRGSRKSPFHLRGLPFDRDHDLGALRAAA